ncbi:MAG: L-2-hydroxyglutarate oxidase [Bacteroidetes bacterium]|nr:L-2-hydroxyglutarate oxidase [Bacteroidota bacterium]
MKYHVIITGAGIVGLATGLKLLEKNPALKLCILEKEDKPAQHQTGHNSGVIHSGIYYKPGSLKATNCISGYHQLIKFCDENGIKYDLCGKIIVASNGKELPALENIFNRGNENKLEGIRKISVAEMKEIEPHVAGVAGLWVPQTGIIDYVEVSNKYAELIIKMGGEIKYNERVEDIHKTDAGVEVITEKNTYNTKLLINCAGLYSDKIAKLTNKNLEVKIIPFRGEYYKIKPERYSLVNNLIYPVPDPEFPFLGVHFTRMIHGGIEAGPNAVLAFKREGYKKTDFNLAEAAEIIAFPGFRKIAIKFWRTGIGEMYRSFSKAAFTKALQKLIPDIREEDLMLGGSGVRAQACHINGNLLDDFFIIEDKGLINVCNAPSPAATSSLAIGEAIANMAEKNG